MIGRCRIFRIFVIVSVAIFAIAEPLSAQLQQSVDDADLSPYLGKWKMRNPLVDEYWLDIAYVNDEIVVRCKTFYDGDWHYSEGLNCRLFDSALCYECHEENWSWDDTDFRNGIRIGHTKNIFIYKLNITGLALIQKSKLIIEYYDKRGDYISSDKIGWGAESFFYREGDDW